MDARVNFDSVGWTYLGVLIGWTVALAAALSFLWTQRDLPSMRMRRLPMLFAGVVALHVYGCITMLVYPVGAAFSCNLEFWIMSIYLPLGIALFHASNTQFLHLASRQKHFAHMSSLKDHDSISEEKAREISNSRWKKAIMGIQRADNVEQTFVFIGIGMLIQVSQLKLVKLTLV